MLLEGLNEDLTDTVQVQIDPTESQFHSFEHPLFAPPDKEESLIEDIQTEECGCQTEANQMQIVEIPVEL